MEKEEKIPEDLGLVMAFSEEEQLLMNEVRASKEALEIQKKSIRANEILITLYEKRLEEIKKENATG